MSNFICEKCGAEILEDEKGHYKTGCGHYLLESPEPKKKGRNCSRYQIPKENKPQAQPFPDGWEKEFDEEFNYCIAYGLLLSPEVIDVKSFIREKIAEAIKEYNEILCLEHNCKEMDRIEQYFARFKDRKKLSDIRKQVLERRGIKGEPE